MAPRPAAARAAKEAFADVANVSGGRARARFGARLGAEHIYMEHMTDCISIRKEGQKEGGEISKASMIAPAGVIGRAHGDFSVLLPHS